MPRRRFLFDVNVLVAFADEAHIAHQKVMKWFLAEGATGWGLCPFTEAGFVRVVTNPKYTGSFTMPEALEFLEAIVEHKGYAYWPVSIPFASAVELFADRLFGHQQVTDAYLLGIAVKNKATLVTLDKAVKALAGSQYAHHVHVLE